MGLFFRWVFLLCLGWPLLGQAQITITYPMSRLVVQRGADGNGQLYVSGRLTTSADRVEAQLTPLSAGQGTTTGWQLVQANPTGNLFLGAISGTGGWYVLTVRTLVGSNVTAQISLSPIGIGEVFVTAGQSNSRGLGPNDNDLGTATDRVNAIDAINHYQPDNAPLVSSGDPLPVPVYQPLTAGRKVYPMAESSWGWGELGDYLVQRFNVPVAFYVTGWDGSTVENWINTANGIPTCNRYFCNGNWPNLQPYTNLKNVMRYYLSMAGARAVLWHQGEAEYSFPDGNTSIPLYYDRLRSLIQKSREDFGSRNLAWMVARASFDGSVTRPELVTEQQRIIDTPGLNVFQGPYNDTITNRNAGTQDVHFRNISRPSPHPQYFQNPNSIPATMGLSRFARNWNNSLNNAFFQNAQPITPTQFAVTNTVADFMQPGDSLRVSFATLGTFGGNNQWEVQLLDSAGVYQSTLGTGTSNPVRVRLPESLTIGRLYQVRVVATSPYLPAVASNRFRAVSSPVNPGPADLSLAMEVSQSAPAQNEPLTISMYLRNDGPNRATNVVVRNRLPDSLQVVSASGLTLAGSTLTGNVASLDPTASVLFRFQARPLARGTYRNTAEVAQVTNADPDSQPNSGTGDGQDDMAETTFRTLQPGTSVFTSPNPNQVPLPGVSSNQPSPDPDKADVSLSLSVSNRSPRQNETVTYTLTLTNKGGLIATGLRATAYLLDGLTFVSSGTMGPGDGGITVSLNTLAVNESVSYSFVARPTAKGQVRCTTQLTEATRTDPDSTPGNSTNNGEDDTDQITIRVR